MTPRPERLVPQLAPVEPPPPIEADELDGITDSLAREVYRRKRELGRAGETFVRTEWPDTLDFDGDDGDG